MLGLHRHLKVEFGRRLEAADGFDHQVRQLEPRLAVRLHRQHRLEQRGVPGVPVRCDGVDDPLERHVRVCEGPQIGLAQCGQQLGERRIGIDVRPQRQRVDEHPDQPVERLVPAAGDRRADRETARAAHPRQQHPENRVQHHEQGCVVRTCDRSEPGVYRLVQLDAHTGAAQVRGSRPRPVPWQRHDRGDPAELVRPEGQLLRQNRRGIALRPQHLALPHREIGVLHRQRFGRVIGSRRCSQVCGHDVAGQRCHRCAVAADVVHDDDEDVLVRAEAEQCSPDRRCDGDIEALVDECANPLGGVGIVRYVDRSQIGYHRFGVDDILVRRSVRVLRVARAQGLVPFHGAGHGGLQCRDVELAAKPQRHRHVVGPGLRFESIEHPHALLRERQRSPLACRSSTQRHIVCVVDA